MKLIKNILGALWAAWGLILFFGTMLLILIPTAITYLIPEPRGSAIFLRIARYWNLVFLYGIGCPIKVFGKQNYQANKQYVVTANHQSLLDVPFFCPFFPGPNKTIAKKSMANIPLFNIVYNRGSVLVDRRSDSSRRQSFQEMKKVLLQEQLNMAIYPEGTRNRGNEPLKPFYHGAFKLAIECQKEVLPVIMLNTGWAMPTNKAFFLRPHPLEMYILPPISCEHKTAEELKQQVYDTMYQFLENSNNRRDISA